MVLVDSKARCFLPRQCLVGQDGARRGKIMIISPPEHPSNEKFRIASCRGLAQPQTSFPDKPVENVTIQAQLTTVNKIIF